MKRKLTAILVLSGVFLINQKVEAPIRHENLYHEKPGIERLFQSELSDPIKKYMELREKENGIAKKDEIFGYIVYAYDSIKVPEYITKKFVRAQIWAESWDTPHARGKKGERGLMQLMPGTWGYIENKLDYEKNAFNPEKNIYVGVKYLSWLAEQADNFHPNWSKINDEEKRKIIAAAYNAGIGRLMSLNWNINKIPKITKRYIQNIENLMEEKYRDY